MLTKLPAYARIMGSRITNLTRRFHNVTRCLHRPSVVSGLCGSWLFSCRALPTFFHYQTSGTSRGRPYDRLRFYRRYHRRQSQFPTTQLAWKPSQSTGGHSESAGRLRKGEGGRDNLFPNREATASLLRTSHHLGHLGHPSAQDLAEN